MNGSRMKYSSTPTYGMQKRSIFKKPAPVRKVPDAPDFSQAPDPAANMPFVQNTIPPMQTPFVQPAAPVQQPVQGFASVPPMQGFAAPAQPPYQQPVFVNQAPMQQPAQQVPFAAPAFMPQSGGMPLPPMQGMTAASQQLPLGNTVSPFSKAQSFSTRSQGFVPPSAPVQQPAMPNVQPVPPVMRQPFSRPEQEPFTQQTMNYAPVQPPVFQPMQPPVMQSPAAPAQAQGGSQKSVGIPSLTVDKLWSIFLFGILPLLFIPCIFVPNSWDFLRYAFLVLTVAGLGGMWYRQMFTSTIRLIVSIVYVALCIATIAILMQGGNDVQRAASMNQPQPAAVQQTPSPADQMAAAAVVITPTPEPPMSGPSEAERRLELFMSLWQMNNATEMVSLVQPSWCSQQENPSQALFTVLKNRTPEEFTIEEISGTETDNSRTITMRATINKNNGKSPTIYRFMIMMVKEGGEWYVNPNSLATNDEVQKTDENVVNNKNAVGDTTEPPRTTVTPAPPASTVLYYNTGANYYHMDPNCASVKAEYLPFDMQFSYGDLKTVMRENNLSPCLKCNAPTNTLD